MPVVIAERLHVIGLSCGVCSFAFWSKSCGYLLLILPLSSASSLLFGLWKWIDITHLFVDDSLRLMFYYVFNGSFHSEFCYVNVIIPSDLFVLSRINSLLIANLIERTSRRDVLNLRMERLYWHFGLPSNSCFRSFGNWGYCVIGLVNLNGLVIYEWKLRRHFRFMTRELRCLGSHVCWIRLVVSKI